jgi:hypothetical protein
MMTLSVARRFLSFLDKMMAVREWLLPSQHLSKRIEWVSTVRAHHPGEGIELRLDPMREDILNKLKVVCEYDHSILQEE